MMVFRIGKNIDSGYAGHALTSIYTKSDSWLYRTPLNDSSTAHSLRYFMKQEVRPDAIERSRMWAAQQLPAWAGQ